ncbi:MAG TPA: flagellar basal-body rod protein FlgG [Candidatus Eremiobacteraceae bacterium]|nr:flagellar basal-body rod protein FlgG [Candidatus Eremiobacteraceae bacterium]
MYRALYTAATGMETQQLNLENVANNLANASTTGFRRRRVQFQDLLYQQMVLPGAASTQQTTFPAGLQIGLGAKSSASEIIQQQGDITSTGNPLDLCIQGQGFFQVQLPTGELAYTRDGSFSLDPTGIIVTSDGYQLQPAITIPPSATNVTIGSDGTVSVQLPGQQQAQQVGTIQLATFANPAGLSSMGQNLFLETTASGNPIVGTPGGSEGLGTILQGSLEDSNVDIVSEFVQMILTQRSYEANSRVVKAADEMFQTINGLTS